MFVIFLRNFMKGRPAKVFLVVDGHPAHRAKRVAEYIQSLKGRLELHFLPPCAPDLNPDEFVWSYMKGNGVSKKPLRQNESLRRRVEEDFRAIKNNPPLIRSFFQAKSVAYAKTSQYVSKADPSTSSLNQFEAFYASRASLRVASYINHRTSTVEASITSNRYLRSKTWLNTSQLAQFKNLIEQAQTKIEAIRRTR